MEESPEQQEQWQNVMAEYEKRSFGTPVFEHTNGFRVSSVDREDDWDVMTPARELGSRHRVGQDEIEALQDEMLAALSDDGRQRGGSTL